MYIYKYFNNSSYIYTYKYITYIYMIGLLEVTKKNITQVINNFDTNYTLQPSVGLIVIYSLLKECMMDGYKKRFLYHLKAIRNITSTLTTLPTITLELRNELVSYNIYQQCIKQALDHYLLRSNRDLYGFIDIQHVERYTKLLKMKENGVSRLKLIESLKDLNHIHKETFLLELIKILYTIASIYLSKDDLMDIPTKLLYISNSNNNMKEDVLYDEDIDDYVIDIKSYNDIINNWLYQTITCVMLYNTCLSSLFIYIEEIDRKQQQHQQSNDIIISQAYINITDEIKINIYKHSTKLILLAYQYHIEHMDLSTCLDANNLQNVTII